MASPDPYQRSVTPESELTRACPRCHHVTKAFHKVCPMCGAPLEGDSLRKKPRSCGWCGCLFLVLLVIAIVIIVAALSA